MKKLLLATCVIVLSFPSHVAAGCYGVEKSMCLKVSSSLIVTEVDECATYECVHYDAASFEFIYKDKSHYIQLVKDGIAFEKPLLDGEEVFFDLATVEHSPEKYTDEDNIFIIRRPNGEAWIIHRHVGPQHD